MANKIGNASSNQQVNDAQHLDNMTSLQQPGEAERALIAQHGEVKGDAPVNNSSPSTPDSPSLFNDPKNPNNKVVEVESEEGDGDEETITSAEESGNQDARSAEELASINNNKLNDVFTVQANGQDGNAQSAAEAAANSNTANQNPGSDAGVGGGSVSPLIRAKVKTGDASTSSSEAQSSESSSSSSSTSSVSTSSSTSSTSSSASVTSVSSFVTPQAQFIPQAPVTNVNEAPTITSGATASVAENTSGTVYTVSATDVDASTTLSYSLSGTDANLFNINSSTGAVTFKVAPNYESPTDAGANNVYDINVIASDGTLSTSQAVAITVTNADDTAPTITSGAVATAIAENSGAAQVVYTASSTDADYVSGSTSYSLSGTDASLFSINSSTGAVTLTANPNFESKANYSFTVVATDAAGNSSNQAVSLAITNVNEAPTITSGATASVAENTSGTVYTVSATDVDASTTLSYSLSGTDANLFNINSSTGAVTFKVAPNYESPTDAGANNVYDINVIASDGTLSTSQAVAITVTNADDTAPTITSGAVATAIAENSGAAQVVYTASSTDADYVSGSTSYSLSGTDASLFSINSSTGAVTLTANPNFESKANYSFTVVATDAAGNSSNQAVSLAITNVNEAPTITSGATASVAENTSGTVYTVSATDVDASTTLSYSLSGTDANLFNINSSTGAVTFKVAPNYESPTDAGANNVYDINVIASDGTLSTSQAVAITVTNADDTAPTITSGAVATAIAENSGAAQVVYTASSTDADYVSGSTSYSLSGTDASLFSINSSTGAVTLTANPNFESKANYSFTVVATDAAGNSSNQAVSLAITNVNEAPTITSGATASVAENTSGTVYTVSATDVDASTTLSYSLSGTDANLFNINSSTGAVTFKVAPNYESPTDAGANNVYDINVIASDGTLSTSQAVAITVTNADDTAPTITSGAVATAIAENSGAAQVVYTASSTDADYVSGSTSYSLSGTDASLFSINSSTGAVTLTANPNFESKANYSFTVVATDAAGNSSNQAVSLAITNVNEAPTITSGATASVAENTSGTVYTVSATDVDASTTLSYSLSGTDANLFNINSSTGAVTFKVAPNYESPTDAGANNVYDINVIASDGTLSTSQAVAITVTNADDTAPTITSGAVATAIAENSGAAQVVYTASSTDADYVSGSTSYSLSGTDASLFSINSSTGAVTLTANPNFESKANYSFTVVATDAAGNSSNQAVSLAITNVNEAPTITSGATASVAENTSGTVYTVSATDVDASTTLSYSLSGTDANLFNINSSTGAVTFKVAPNYESPTDAGANNVYDINVIASDGTLSTSQAVAITVTNADDTAPTITSGAVATAIAENSGAAQVVYTASSTDADYVSGSTSYSLSGTDASLFSINSSTGAVTLTANPNFESKANYSFTVVATDAAGNSSNQAVSLAITNVNEAPTITSGATASVAENTSGTVYTVSATDVDASTTLSYSLSGTDANLFNINSSTGAVTFKVAPNYESPTDAGANNVYDINVIASDGTLSTSQAVAITATNMDEVAPSITSLGTGSASENQNVLYTATATDTDFNTAGITWSVTGSDASLLNISSGGVVTLKTGNLDYESGKTSYSFNVVATDNAGNATPKAVSVDVTDIHNVVSTDNVQRTYIGTAESDRFNFSVDDSSTVAASDTVSSFNVTWDKLYLGTTSTPANGAGNGADVGSGGNAVKSHSITNGIITFSNGTTYGTPLVINTATRLASAKTYLQSFDFGNSGSTVAFQVSTGTGITTAGTYVYQQIGDLTTTNTSDKLIFLSGVTGVTNTNQLVTSVAVPISIDLNCNGIQYLNQSAGVTYDFSGDGFAELTAWVAPEDGLLANQRVDGTHNIVFSTQAGETDLEGLAKVYDTNFDKVLDAKDSGFNDFGVWQDADSDGVVDAGEFLSLADRGIISLSLTSDGIMNTAADGDVLIYGQTTYTMTDGSLGIAEDVAFAVSDINQTDANGVQDVYQIASVANSPLAIDDFNVDEGDFVDLSAILNPTNRVQSTVAIDADGSESSHSTITVNIGGVDYEVATLYGKELGVGDVLGDHAGGASLTDSLNGADWTDVVDISSEFGGPASISEAGGSLTNAYSNEGSDWTVQIKSGTATVDAANKEINFTSDNAENLAIITTADGTLHEISNVDKILWR